MKWQFALACVLGATDAYTNESLSNKRCFGKKVDLNAEPFEKTLFFVQITKKALGFYCRTFIEQFYPEESYECIAINPREGEYITKVRYHKHDCYQKDNLTNQISDTVSFQYYEIEELYRSETVNFEYNDANREGKLGEVIGWLASEGITRPGVTVEEELAIAKEFQDENDEALVEAAEEKKMTKKVSHYLSMIRDMQIEAHKECWSSAKINHNLDVFNLHQPSFLDEIKYADLIEKKEDETDRKTSTLPRNYSTQDCNLKRGQHFDPEAEDALFQKLKVKIEKNQEKGNEMIDW